MSVDGTCTRTNICYPVAIVKTCGEYSSSITVAKTNRLFRADTAMRTSLGSVLQSFLIAAQLFRCRLIS